jgi:hypothetical protein
MKTVRLKKHLEHSLCLYPELIDDGLWGIRQGMEVLGAEYPTLKRQDRMPNGTVADMVFVQSKCVWVVEIKRGMLRVKAEKEVGEDVIDQVAGYLRQCRLKYPNRDQYRGIVIGTGIADRHKFSGKLTALKEDIKPLVFGTDIPSVIKFCRCGRALDYNAVRCSCGTRCT